MTAAIVPVNFPRIKMYRGIGLERVVRMVFVSISSVIAAEALKVAMNKPAIKSVDNPNSLKSLLSSSIVYIDNDGLRKNRNTAAATITA